MNGFNKLIFWYLNGKRNLPWRDETDPYRVWVSEIILQQTRVKQGLPYYFRFVNTFPDVFALANAEESEVLKVWQGLGYYSRARNMHSAARHVALSLNGVFPDTYEGLLKLKGVGPYTAAAIASFAYGLPHAAVDGNVARVLSRAFDIDEAVNAVPGAKRIAELAESVMDRKRPDLHNQAMMELGATICTPHNPQCPLCPIADVCLARMRNTIKNRPVKIAAKKPSVRHIDYAVIETEAALVFRRRSQDDIWKGLHDFAALEGYAEMDPKRLAGFVAESFPEAYLEESPKKPEMEFAHMLTHRRLNTRFWKFKLAGGINDNSLYLSVDKNKVGSLPVPRPVERYLQAHKWI